MNRAFSAGLCGVRNPGALPQLVMKQRHWLDNYDAG
jgi:hypothetical protein